MLPALWTSFNLLYMLCEVLTVLSKKQHIRICRQRIKYTREHDSGESPVNVFCAKKNGVHATQSKRFQFV